MSSPPGTPTPTFPSHSNPRVWFLTSGTAPVAIALARQLLDHGDHVAAGLPPNDILALHQEGGDERITEFREFLKECGDNANCPERDEEGKLMVVSLDIRSMAQCQAAIAKAVHVFGRLDILLCCTSETVIGTVEELSTPPRQTMTLVRDQFETNFFGPVNILKAALPTLRTQRSGHIIVLTGTTGHLGTPGLGMYCAANWAIEGFCDSLAYEIPSFNIKLSIIQPNLEISVLTNKITSAPPLPFYSPSSNPAPLSREIIGNLIERLQASSPSPSTPSPSATPSQPHVPKLSDDGIVSLYPPLPTAFKESLLGETVHALTAIGGHENPPARHIVGHEAVASVKEKLKTVSEELEDFVEISGAVDI